MFYDPMIAKLVTHGADARSGHRCSGAMPSTAFYIDGIQHNIPFLSAIMQHPRWRKGALSTGFIAEEYPGRLPARACRRARSCTSLPPLPP